MILHVDWRHAIKRSEDAVRLLVYALAWVLLMPLQLKFGRGLASYIVILACVLVIIAWTRRVELRLREGMLSRWWSLPWVGVPVILIGFLVQLRIIGGILALVLFVLTQIPIVFIKRKTSAASNLGNGKAK